MDVKEEDMGMIIHWTKVGWHILVTCVHRTPIFLRMGTRRNVFKREETACSALGTIINSVVNII